MGRLQANGPEPGIEPGTTLFRTLHMAPLLYHWVMSRPRLLFLTLILKCRGYTIQRKAASLASVRLNKTCLGTLMLQYKKKRKKCHFKRAIILLLVICFIINKKHRTFACRFFLIHMHKVNIIPTAPAVGETVGPNE